MEYSNSLFSITQKSKAISRSVCPENYTGEKGKGGMATEGPALGCARELGQGWKISPYVLINPGTVFTMADIHAEGFINHIWITDGCPRARGLIIRMYWDDSDIPSVEAPLGDFFACADYLSYHQLTSMPVCVNPARAMNCYWKMPFKKGFKITLENVTSDVVPVYYQIDYTIEEVPADSLYFHAQFRRTNPVHEGDVYTILDNVQGNGQYVGTYMYWGQNNNGWWGEGEIKFYLDGDTDFPTICGTGTEDYFCGSYNFDVAGHYTEYTTPYAGLAAVSQTNQLYNCNQRFSLYRWHIPDPIFFNKDIRVTIQDLGWRSEGRYLQRQDDISSVAFWYQEGICQTFPTLPNRNALEII